MTTLPQRHWRQNHDNGWLAHVASLPDGTFMAWAAPSGALPIGVDYIEDCLEHAQAAAEFSLRRETAHTACSALCSSWEPAIAALDRV